MSKFTQGYQTYIDVGLNSTIQVMKRYNNVLFDGRSTKLEILGGNIKDAFLQACVNATGMNERMKRTDSIEDVLLFDLSFFH